MARVTEGIESSRAGFTVTLRRRRRQKQIGTQTRVADNRTDLCISAESLELHLPEKRAGLERPLLSLQILESYEWHIYARTYGKTHGHVPLMSCYMIDHI